MRFPLKAHQNFFGEGGTLCDFYLQKLSKRGILESFLSSFSKSTRIFQKMPGHKTSGKIRNSSKNSMSRFAIPKLFFPAENGQKTLNYFGSHFHSILWIRLLQNFCKNKILLTNPSLGGP